MKNLIIGASSRFGERLHKVLTGVYLTRIDLDIGMSNVTYLRDRFDNIRFDNVIVLVNNRSNNIAEAARFIQSLFDTLDYVDFDKAFLFTSGKGTYIQSKDSKDLSYSVEKMLLNFVSYKRNFDVMKYILVHPGHMSTVEEYDQAVNLFIDSFGNIPRKNLIWNLQKKAFMPF